jgi:hypothetical protein
MDGERLHAPAAGEPEIPFTGSQPCAERGIVVER